ncbi:hypothetical protein [Bradyrhizobium sp. SZCCHNS2096]|uniref:hypothetical protein n=1 Tax=Bradyrhizobium sp. SZCCHNS2096 TaxID=3057309 RepID=UPI002916B7CC|nr:hypothetical protein [Bradyrhizobium sp. SZCCHNS2096]
MDDEERLLQLMLSSVRSILRIVFVSAIYFSLLVALDAGVLKSAVAACIVFVLLAVGVGRTTLEQLALWSTVLLIVDWAGLLPVRAWGHAIVAIINRELI